MSEVETVTTADSRELAHAAALNAVEKKATDIVIIDMRKIAAFTDYMVLATGQNTRQTKAIAEEVRRQLRDERGARPKRIEGDREGDWILLDFLDIVVHVFTPEAREFYRLDRLWRKAPQERLEDDGSFVARVASPILEDDSGD